MRLHTLEVTAFGPFAGSVTVDFDQLSSSGLFLLTGPTGAGKSSVLDAVCFAFYGDVPGDRASAKRLRCDLAPDERAPRVSLLVTLGDRRFRITRSPSWERPKRRGTGLTTQQASVLVEELTGDDARVLTTRLDEAGHLISGLLGMNLAQFCQVAMLPQGRFQEFLRARSEDRHRLLQQLFRTRRFEDIERWLRDHRLELRRRLDAAEAELTTLVHRLDEAGDEHGDLPGGRADELLRDDRALVAWSDRVVRDANGHAQEAAERSSAALVAAEGADAARAEAAHLASLQARDRRAREQLAVLATQAEEVTQLQARLDDAQRAAPVRALNAVAQRARQRRAEADCRLAELLDSGVLSAVEAADPVLVAAELQTNGDALARMPGLLTLEREREASARRRGELEAEVTRLRATGAVLTERAGLLPQEIAATTGALTRATEAGHLLPAARAAAEEARLRQSAAAELAATRIAHQAATERLREFVDAHQASRESWLQLHEARLLGMAAELASDLAVGASCPVCGSCEHPDRAQAAHGAPSAKSEREARRAVDDAEVARQAQADIVRGLDSRLAVLAEQSGGEDVATAIHRRELARHRAGELEALAGEREPLSERLASVTAERERIQHDLTSSRTDLAAAESALGELVDRLAELDRRLAEELADGTTAAARQAALLEQQGALTRLNAAHSDVHTTLAAESGAAVDVVDAALAQGFTTTGAAVDALLPDHIVARHRETIRAHHEECAVAQAHIDDPEVCAAAALPAPDLDRLTEAHSAAARSARQGQSESDAASRRAARTAALRAELAQRLDSWRPLRDAHALAHQVASFAEGKATDNRDQMRLSAYVLAWRLGQVVDAANSRLNQMTDERFTLEHTTRRGARETRGGLSLLIRDAWSGEARDPVTLSGGETFVVSLALALGLTDVVTHEAGGADIGTLFVDEGFGTLDADTLDDVMDTLDTLRDGGRAVGIVSHVPELRTRIPTQLRVTKGRAGSGLHQVHESA